MTASDAVDDTAAPDLFTYPARAIVDAVELTALDPLNVAVAKVVTTDAPTLSRSPASTIRSAVDVADNEDDTDELDMNVAFPEHNADAEQSTDASPVIENTPVPDPDAAESDAPTPSLTLIESALTTLASPTGFAEPVLTLEPLPIDDDAVLDVPYTSADPSGTRLADADTDPDAETDASAK